MARSGPLVCPAPIDVASGIEIKIGGVVAMKTNVYTVSKRLVNQTTTLAARLRHVVGRHGNHLHASFCRFAVQDRQEARPARTSIAAAAET